MVFKLKIDFNFSINIVDSNIYLEQKKSASLENFVFFFCPEICKKCDSLIGHASHMEQNKKCLGKKSNCLFRINITIYPALYMYSIEKTVSGNSKNTKSCQ